MFIVVIGFELVEQFSGDLGGNDQRIRLRESEQFDVIGVWRLLPYRFEQFLGSFIG